MATRRISMPDDVLPMLVEKYGAYFFEKMDESILDAVIGSGDTEGLEPVYVVGCAVNVCVRKDTQGRVLQETYIPLESFNAPESMELSGPATLFLVYTDGSYPSEGVKSYRCDTTKPLERLFERAELRKILAQGTPAGTLAYWLSTWQAQDAKEEAVQTGVSAVTAEQESPVQLAREEVLELLHGEQERVSGKVRSDFKTEEEWQHNRRLVAMYVAVISAYELHLKQNRSAKLVRMADGSRKWFPNDRAAELLELPREKRI